MASIWQDDGSNWNLLSPSGFADEAALHRLVEDAPHTLPLAGSPSLIMLGREVLLGGNYADLIALEPSGRLAIIEIKLARNAEARRAVIAQILTYAAYLRGMDIATLERDVLGPHLERRNYENLTHAVVTNDQEGSHDAEAFANELASSLEDGRFRLVLVLDEAPEELAHLVGYLGAVADKLLIDLISVSAYQIGSSQIIVPQRVDSERQSVTRSRPQTPRPGSVGRFVEGSQDFQSAIQNAAAEQRSLLQRLLDWANTLEQAGLVRLGTYHGKSGLLTLLPRLPSDNVGMVTVYYSPGPGGAYLQFWRRVIERRAPESLHCIEAAAAPAKVGQGSTTRSVSDELLAALSAAYQEAAKGHVEFVSGRIPRAMRLENINFNVAHGAGGLHRHRPRRDRALRLGDAARAHGKIAQTLYFAQQRTLRIGASARAMGRDYSLLLSITR